MQKTNNAPYIATLYDKVMADTIGIPVKDYLEITEKMSPEQLEYITSKLISLDDNEVKAGIVEFNSF